MKYFKKGLFSFFWVSANMNQRTISRQRQRDNHDKDPIPMRATSLLQEPPPPPSISKIDKNKF